MFYARAFARINLKTMKSRREGRLRFDLRPQMRQLHAASVIRFDRWTAAEMQTEQPQMKQRALRYLAKDEPSFVTSTTRCVPASLAILKFSILMKKFYFHTFDLSSLTSCSAFHVLRDTLSLHHVVPTCMRHIIATYFIIYRMHNLSFQFYAIWNEIASPSNKIDFDFVH